MTVEKIRFEHGDLLAIAKAAGISPQFLTNCLKGRRNLRAKHIEAIIEAAEALGYHTSPFDWNFPLNTENPLFKKYQK